MIHPAASVDDIDEQKLFCLGEIKKEKERSKPNRDKIKMLQGKLLELETERENLDRLAHESNISKNTKFNTLPHQFELCEPKAHVSPCKGR